MTEGNWRVGVCNDDAATDAQFDQLVQVFSGQLGGSMAGLAPLIGEMLGVQRAAIELQDDGLLGCEGRSPASSMARFGRAWDRGGSQRDADAKRGTGR